jgi:hypothetical protein
MLLFSNRLYKATKLQDIFDLNQLLSSGLNISSPVIADFISNGLTTEAGGKSKNSEHVKHLNIYLPRVHYFLKFNTQNQ